MYGNRMIHAVKYVSAGGAPKKKNIRLQRKHFKHIYTKILRKRDIQTKISSHKPYSSHKP